MIDHFATYLAAIILISKGVHPCTVHYVHQRLVLHGWDSHRATFHLTMDSFVNSADIISCLFYCLHECAPFLGFLPRFLIDL